MIYRIAFYSREKGRIENPRAVPEGEQYQAIREQMLALVDELEQRQAQRWEIRSRDGLKLSARFYIGKKGAPLEICFHGYRGSAIRDFCGGSKIAFKNGHHMLLVDQRAHGRSEGKCITFGVKERYDCLDWARYAVERLGAGTEVFLSGVSMGAATVLMASELPLPENVRGIVADCPYSSPEEIIETVGRRAGLPMGLCMPLVRMTARLRCGFSLGESSAREAVRRAKAPILILHGEDDRFVPCEMSREIAAAGRNIQLENFPGAGHGLSYLADTPRYERIVEEFQRRVLNYSE